MKIPAVILAAGLGTRMGSCKALMRIDGETLLKRTAQNLLRSGAVKEIFVVTGAYADQVKPEAETFEATVVFNPDYKTGLMSSLQCGVAVVPVDAPAAFITPVDMPLVSPSTIQRLVGDKTMGNKLASDVLYRPFFNDEPGHPCLIGRNHFKKILEQPYSDEGAAFLFKEAGNTAWRMNGEDRGFDTLADLEAYHHASRLC